jgi:hypothetical protein
MKTKVKEELMTLSAHLIPNSVDFMLSGNDYDLKKVVTETLTTLGRSPNLEWDNDSVSFSFEVICPQDFEAFQLVDEILEGSLFEASSDYQLTGEIWSYSRSQPEAILSIKSRPFTCLTPHQIQKIIGMMDFIQDEFHELF